ncbi:hypothetical protein AGDE_16822 [Angomonas deanei]|nr:hypothetical protein AGDE_16822 [Angomonas deanei]|eukprot:EPY16113.1 hypothetical protein AGDE_16822 [Angomonas deanei]
MEVERLLAQGDETTLHRDKNDTLKGDVWFAAVSALQKAYGGTEDPTSGDNESVLLLTNDVHADIHSLSEENSIFSRHDPRQVSFPLPTVESFLPVSAGSLRSAHRRQRSRVAPSTARGIPLSATIQIPNTFQPRQTDDYNSVDHFVVPSVLPKVGRGLKGPVAVAEAPLPSKVEDTLANNDRIPAVPMPQVEWSYVY